MIRPARLQFGFFKSANGWCAAAWTAQGLAALVLPRKDREDSLGELRDHFPRTPAGSWEGRSSAVPRSLRAQVRKALDGKGSHWASFDLSPLTPFQKRVLDATRLIPRGQVRTYAWVAKKAGSPRGFRAAGQALNRNPVPLFIPCHRVIASGGGLGGYGGGLGWKIRLLKKEGVTIKRGLVM